MNCKNVMGQGNPVTLSIPILFKKKTHFKANKSCYSRVVWVKFTLQLVGTQGGTKVCNFSL